MFFGTLAGLLNRPIAVITRTVISSAAADAADILSVQWTRYLFAITNFSRNSLGSSTVFSNSCAKVRSC